MNRLESTTQSNTCPLAVNNDVEGTVRLPVKILNQSYSQYLLNFFIPESALNDRIALKSHWLGLMLPDSGEGTLSGDRRKANLIYNPWFDPTKSHFDFKVSRRSV